MVAVTLLSFLLRIQNNYLWKFFSCLKIMCRYQILKLPMLIKITKWKFNVHTIEKRWKKIIKLLCITFWLGFVIKTDIFLSSAPSKSVEFPNGIFNFWITVPMRGPQYCWAGSSPISPVEHWDFRRPFFWPPGLHWPILLAQFKHCFHRYSR